MYSISQSFHPPRGPCRAARRWACLALASLSLTAAVGCQPNPSSADPVFKPTGPSAAALPTSMQVLKKGKNFSYIVSPGGTVSVYDTAANQLVLRTQVSPQTLVKVDAKTGVYTGTTQVVKGPLNPNGTFELRLEH